MSGNSIGCLSIISTCIYMVCVDNVQCIMFLSTVSIYSASCLFIAHIYVFIGQDVHLLFRLTQNNVSSVIVYLLILNL